MIISDYGKKCVVIDLDETLVHSSFKVRGEASVSIDVVCICHYEVVKVRSCVDQINNYSGHIICK